MSRQLSKLIYSINNPKFGDVFSTLFQLTLAIQSVHLGRLHCEVLRTNAN